MVNVVATRLIQEHTLQTQTYETIATTQDLCTRIGQITRRSTEPMALVTIKLYFEHEGKGFGSRSAHIEQSTTYLLQSLRSLVRKTDIVLLLNSTIHFLLFDANIQGGKLVQERLWDALLWRIHNSIDGEITRPVSIAISHSAFPHPCASIEELIEVTDNEQLRFDLHTEKPTRKTTTRSHTAQSQKQGELMNEELPMLARKLGIPYLSLLPRKPPQRVQQLVNRNLAQALRCYPIGRERNTLTVAMVDPQDRSALDRLRQETGLWIFPVLTNPSKLQTALEQLG